MKLTTNYGSCVDMPYGSHPDYIMFDCHKEPEACIACYNPRVEGDFLVWDCDIGNHDNKRSQLYRYGENGKTNLNILRKRHADIQRMLHEDIFDKMKSLHDLKDFLKEECLKEE